MRTGIVVEVTAAGRARLEAVVADRNSPQKQVWRARIVLLTADGCGTAEITRRTGKAKTAVWRWQERFMREGADGLLRDKTRPSRIPPLTPEVAERVVAGTLADPPGEAHLALARAPGAPGSDQPLRRGDQRQPAPLPLDQEPGSDHRRGEAWAPSVALAPLRGVASSKTRPGSPVGRSGCWRRPEPSPVAAREPARDAEWFRVRPAVRSTAPATAAAARRLRRAGPRSAPWRRTPPR